MKQGAALRPLVEWHVHLDGSLKPGTVLAIASNNGVVLKGDDDAIVTDEVSLMRAVRWDATKPLMRNILIPFGITTSVMQRECDLERVAYELVEQWKADGVLYGEMRFMPTLHRREGLHINAVMEAVIAGMKRGECDFGVVSRLIVCSMRHVPVDETELNIAAALRYKEKGVVGVDMAGDDSVPAITHAVYFRRAASGGLFCDIHAAETGPPERVREALQLFDASRGGHLIRMGEDEGLLAKIVARRFPFAVCPTTNELVGVVASVAEHPAKRYLKRGAKLSIHTDNRLMSDVTLTGEYERVVREWGLTRAEHARMIQNAIEGSFASADVKQMLRAEHERDAES